MAVPSSAPAASPLSAFLSPRAAFPKSGAFGGTLRLQRSNIFQQKVPRASNHFDWQWGYEPNVVKNPIS